MNTNYWYRHCLTRVARFEVQHFNFLHAVLDARQHIHLFIPSFSDNRFMFPFFDLSTRPSICPSIVEPSLRSFILSIFSFVCSPVHSFTLIRSCVLSFVRSSVLSLLRSFFRSFICSFARSPACSFVRPFSVHLFVRPFDRSFGCLSVHYICIFCRRKIKAVAWQ